MALPNDQDYEHYIGANNLAIYSFNFKIVDETHLGVYQTSLLGVTTKLVLGMDYTVNEVTDPDDPDQEINNELGFVTLSAGNLGTGVLLHIYREAPFVQITAIRNQGKYLPEIHENAFDYLMMGIQRLNTMMDRVLKIPIGTEEDIDTDFTGTLVPGYAIVVNEDGDGFEIASVVPSFANVGSSPNNAGGSVSGYVITLQPADSTHPGVLTAVAQAIGGIKTFIANIRRSAQTGITAYAGGGQALATVLTKDINNVTTVAADGDSVLLIDAIAGAECIVINSSTKSINVFPKSGSSIDSLAVDAAFQVDTTRKITRFICPTAGLWKSVSGGVNSDGMKVIGSDADPLLIDQAVGVPFSGYYMHNLIFVGGLGDNIIVTADPQIAPGNVIGQKLTLICSYGGYFIALEDERGLDLDGNMRVSQGDAIEFYWNGTAWYSMNRRTR